MLNYLTKMRNKKGFTLVELMVVVVIIGILVAIAIPVYTGTQASAKASADKANLRILNGALAQWAASAGVDLTIAASTVEATVKAAIVPAYIKTIPKSPYGSAADWDGYTYTAGTGAIPAIFTSTTVANN